MWFYHVMRHAIPANFTITNRSYASRFNTGPTRHTGAAQYLIKVVFPVEYWPTSSTMGLLWKSAASRAGE